ncbi:MAG: energy-coupled thiamine transporter ThiT [Pseudobutyrivibrio sp.]|nr:energy-coupled thiamine transporter ThiT [Pseudobutyrivibrio sp.]
MINHISNSDAKISFSAKKLAFCAMSMALAFVLSNIKVFKFPTGGSITLLSMLVACLPGFWFGPVVGIITGVAYGLLNLIVDPYILFPAQVIVDYILAFGALGLSGFFKNAKHGLIKGYIAAVLGRYVFAVISGWIFFGEWAWDGWNPFAYSLAYNAIYIFAEAAITIVILLLPPVKQVMNKLKDMANE